MSAVISKRELNGVIRFDSSALFCDVYCIEEWVADAAWCWELNERRNIRDWLLMLHEVELDVEV